MVTRARRLLRPSAIGLMALTPLVAQEREFRRSFPLSTCTFSNVGSTKYFILEPGHTQVLENGKGVQLTITVLDRTEQVGGVGTRVVEERQIERGELVGVSLNYFAICAEDASVYYFGEAVDNYKNGMVVNHDGAWRHGTAGATAGLMMPALPLLGARYYQEVAPGVAMDRAEVTGVAERLRTPYGSFEKVLVTRESTPLEPGVSEIKAYAPGIGIIRDDDLLLVSVKTSGPRR